MKSLKNYLVLAFMAIAGTASASDIIESKAAPFAVDLENGWDRVFVSYNPGSMKGDGASVSFPGFSFGYMKGFAVAQNMPIYLEPGVALQYRGHSEGDFKETHFGLNIPVNAIYKFAINDDFSIDPFIGIDLRFNIIGKESYDGDGSVNLFDKDEVGEDGKYGRFQAGWHIGCGFNYKPFNFSISYGQDFNEIVEGAKFATTVISLGYSF